MWRNICVGRALKGLQQTPNRLQIFIASSAIRADVMLINYTRWRCDFSVPREPGVLNLGREHSIHVVINLYRSAKLVRSIPKKAHTEEACELLRWTRAINSLLKAQTTPGVVSNWSHLPLELQILRCWLTLRITLRRGIVFTKVWRNCRSSIAEAPLWKPLGQKLNLTPVYA